MKMPHSPEHFRSDNAVCRSQILLVHQKCKLLYNMDF